MTTRAEQARIFNEAIAQGLTEDQALRAAGITNPDDFTYGYNTGKLEPVVLAPPRRPNETIVPQGTSIDAGDEDSGFRTTVVSAQSTTTSQTTVTGGSVRTTTVTPTTYRDTAASTALSAEAQRLEQQKQARADELRAQGLTGAQILRDPEYRSLSSSAQDLQNQAQDARAVDQVGTVSVTTSPGTGTVNENTPNSSYLINNSTGVDPNANISEISQTAVRSGPGAPPLSEIVVTPSDVATVDVTGDQERTLLPVDQSIPSQDPQANRFVFDENGELVPADSDLARDIVARESQVQNFSPDPVPTFVSYFDPENGWSVRNELTGEVVAQNLTEQQAILFAQDANTAGFDSAVNEEVNRQIDFAEAEAANIAAQTDESRAQQAIAEWRRQANAGDWRVRLRLAPNSNYLYNDPEIQSGSILWPLRVSGGVIFPYTPQINTVYKANYSSYDLTHSNYRGWFYQNSYVEDLQLTATFTAQDTDEANYLLAVIHFFRSVTKMFYGQDAQRGAPPPLVFLQGLGQYQFNLQPCLVGQFNYNLPADVDYIRAGSRNVNGVNFLARRDRETVAANPFDSARTRLKNAGLWPGADRKLPGNYNIGPTPPTLGTDSPTYVPTKLDITLILHPVQNRQQVSQEFSLRGFANGTLLRDPQSKGSFW